MDKEEISNLDIESLKNPGAQAADKIRCVCIADTHGITNNLQPIPDGDILLHAGDFTVISEIEDIISFNEFLGELPHKHKIVIAGNHELLFDERPSEMKTMYKELIFPEKYSPQYVKSLLTNCIYLQDENINIMGYNIYGSPWQPSFWGWAFNLETLQERMTYWERIPLDTDILLVHGPPLGIGDSPNDPERKGCQGLLDAIQNTVIPKLVVFGHYHQGYGAWTHNSTLYLNASMVNIDYKPLNKPLVIDLPKKY